MAPLHGRMWATAWFGKIPARHELNFPVVASPDLRFVTVSFASWCSERRLALSSAGHRRASWGRAAAFITRAFSQQARPLSL